MATPTPTAAAPTAATTTEATPAASTTSATTATTSSSTTATPVTSSTSESKAPCCPPGTVGWVPPLGEHVNRGEVVVCDGLKVYVVGKGAVGIVVFPEIFGIESGRLTQNCDTLADMGFAVALGDYQRGDYDRTDIPAWVGRHPWSRIEHDINTHVIPLLEARGAKKLAAMGNCWGSWPSIKMAGTGKFAAAAYCHPSHYRICGLYNESFDALVDAIKCPVLSYAAGNDHESMKPGGAEEKVVRAKPFGAKCEYKEFPDVPHGWVSRTPLTEPNVARDYAIAFGGVMAFFKRILIDTA